MEKKLNYNSKPQPRIHSVSVKPFTHNGIRYYKSSDDIVYEAAEPQGLWDETTKTIIPITEDEVENEEDSDSESDYEEE